MLIRPGVLAFAVEPLSRLTPGHILDASFAAITTVQFLSDVVIISIGITTWVVAQILVLAPHGYRVISPPLKTCIILIYICTIHFLATLVDYLNAIIPSALRRSVLLVRSVHSFKLSRRAVTYTILGLLLALLATMSYHCAHYNAFEKAIGIVRPAVEREQSVR